MASVPKGRARGVTVGVFACVCGRLFALVAAGGRIGGNAQLRHALHKRVLLVPTPRASQKGPSVGEAKPWITS